MRFSTLNSTWQVQEAIAQDDAKGLKQILQDCEGS